MERITRDYDKTQKQLSKTDEKLNAVITEAAVTNSKVNELVGEIRRDREDSQRLHGMIFEEFKSVHKRVTENRVEAVKMIGNAQLASTQANGEIKASQVETKGILKGKIDWAEATKLVLLISAILGIFKYVLPNGG
jgi:hypothetical protein